MVQMAATDLRRAEPLQCISERLLLRWRARLKFKLVVHLAAPHWIATDRARRACAVAVERAARFSCWQSAVQDCFARFRSEDWLGGHGSPPPNGCARPRTAHAANQGKPRWEREPKLSHGSDHTTTPERMLALGDPRSTLKEMYSGALLIFRRLRPAPSRPDGPLSHLAELPRDLDRRRLSEAFSAWRVLLRAQPFRRSNSHAVKQR